VSDVILIHPINSDSPLGSVITRRTGVFPQMKAVAFDCGQCGEVLGPFQNDVVEVRPHSCTNCQSPGPFKVNVSKTVYRNYQKIALQESPGSVPPGTLERD
jgi:DNA replication licensing factor MCM2